MPIRPIDMQTMLPRLQKQHVAKEVVVHKDQNAQHNNQMRNAEAARKKLQKVQKNEQKDAVNIRKKEREEREKNSNKNKKKKKLVSKEKKRDDKESEKEVKPYLRRSHFDMKI